MRILQLSDLYPPVIGGTERHTQRLAGELADRGHESLVATLAVDGAAPFEIGPHGEEIHRLPSLSSRIPGAHSSGARPYHPPFADPIVTRQLRALVRDRRPDVVYAHNWIIYSYLPIHRKLRVPLVYVLHDYCATCPAKTLLRRDGAPCSHRGGDRLACATGTYGRLRGSVIEAGFALSNRRLAKASAKVVAISDAVAEASHIGLGADTAITIIPTFVADGLVQRVTGRPRPAFLPAEPYILFVGALGWHKGVETLLDAFARLAQPKPKLVLLAARGSDLPPPLPRDVALHTDVAHDDVMVAWRDCLFGVVPSAWAEPFGQVALEALTVGRPLIASNAGGLRDFVLDGVNGLLVEPGSVEGLRSALRRMIDDPALRDRLAAKASDGVARFTVSAVADLVEALLVDLTARERPMGDA